MNGNDHIKVRDSIRYLLLRISDHDILTWYMLGTESYTRLLEAYAILTGQTKAEIEERFQPQASRDPYAYSPEEPGKALHTLIRDDSSTLHYLKYKNWSELSDLDREDISIIEEELFRKIHHR